MSTATITYTQTYHLVTCCKEGCGITFGLPNDWVKMRREDHAWWYCPNGHQQHWDQANEEERLRKENARLKDDRTWYADQMSAARKDAEHQRRKAAAARGQLTKIKNKVANGVCPVPGCKRSFTNVLDHLRTVHPTYHTHEEK